MDIHKLVDKRVSLQGIAKEAKGGPVILTPENHVIYIRNLMQWPQDLEDKQVSVNGILRNIKFIPDPVVDEKGAISCGAYGDQYVLDDAKFSKAE